MKMSDKQYKRIAAVICLALLFVFLMSVGAPHHDCLGKKCTVCCLFDVVKKILQCLFLIIFGICAVSAYCPWLWSNTGHPLCQKLTPTQMKVRLLN